MKTLLVLGGGIGGVEAAIALTKKFKHRRDYRVKLISDRETLFIYPLAIWIPVGKRTPEQISLSLPKLAQRWNFDFHHEKVERIESREQQVMTDRQTHRYDYLVVALGADKLRPEGVEHTLSVCGGAEESVRIRDRFLQIQDGGTLACGFSGNPKDASSVRGGPVFEVLFNLDAQLRREKRRDLFKLVFFSPAADAGKRLGGPGVKALQTLFAQRGIEPMLGKKIKAFKPDGILWEDGEFLPTRLTLFTPGLQGPEVLKRSDLPLTEAGFIPVTPQAQVAGTPGLETAADRCYVIGDSAAFEGPEWRAKQGHFAEVMAHVAAANIYQRVLSKPQTATFTRHFNVLCVMDLGNTAAFIYRDAHRALAPVGRWAHWAKLGWEHYYKLTKKGIIPTLPF